MFNDMNIQKIISFLICFNSCFFFAQGYQVLYKVNFKPQKDSTGYRTEYMSLDIQSKTKSIFQSTKKKDSLSKEASRTYLQFILTQNDREYNYYGNFNNLYFVYSQPLKTDWIITNYITEYGGYKVQQAKIELEGRKWTALFTNDIPINKGPYKFSGLPGLILKVYSEDGDYSFEMTELLKQNTADNSDNLINTKKYTTIKRQKVEVFIQNFLKEPGIQNFKLFNNFGDSFTYTYSGEKDSSYKQMNQFIRKIFSKYDNPIDKKTYILVF
jgi:GLPGLI family protein